MRDALIAASFWALDRDGVDWPIDGDDQRTIAAAIASRGLDGTDWVIGGARAAPSAVWGLFFDLAGPPLAKVRIY